MSDTVNIQWTCRQCGAQVITPDDVDPAPACPRCGGTMLWDELPEPTPSIEELEATYQRELRALDWDYFLTEAKREVSRTWEGAYEGHYFLGTVFSLVPSGKFWTVWANSNVDDDEMTRDSVWMEMLEEVAAEHGMYAFNGEGDPCDLFLGVSYATKTEAEADGATVVRGDWDDPDDWEEAEEETP